MFTPYNFVEGDPVIKRFVIPGDYMSRVHQKLVVGFKTEDIILSPNAWVVNFRDPQNVAVEGLWKRMVEYAKDNPVCDGTGSMPLRYSDRSIASLIYFGDSTVHDPASLEATRLIVVTAMNDLTYLHEQGLRL